MKKIVILTLLLVVLGSFVVTSTDNLLTEKEKNIEEIEDFIVLSPSENTSITGKVTENGGLPYYYYTVPVIVTLAFVFIFIILIIIGRMIGTEIKTSRRKHRLRPVTGLIAEAEENLKETAENIADAVQEEF